MKGTLKNFAAFAVIAACLGAAMPSLAAERGGMDETGPYQVVENWFKPGFPRWHQLVTSIAIDTPDRILISSADEHAARPGSLLLNPDGVPEKGAAPLPDDQKTHLHLILALDANGKVVEDWSQWNDQIVAAHSIYISPYDKERHVWVIDLQGHQILKFTNDGKKLVMRLGEKGVSGADHDHFNVPAGMAFLPDGSFYVADGYKNTRVVKFDKDGKYQFEWGAPGAGPGQFNLVHSIAIDAKKRVYVADHDNNRIQIFDEHGKYLDEWDNVRSPAFLMVSADNKSLWVASNGENRIVKYDLNGVLQTSWGVKGTFPGAVDNLHHFAVDQAGDLYIADCFNNRVQKFVPRPGADKARLVDQPFVFK
jgi:DNA-binding beta-propeller fold protein YncE